MSNLFNKQVIFSGMVADLIRKSGELGFQITLGECYRTPEQAKWNAEHGKGISKSLHILRLAVDINLFKAGKLLTDSTDYKPLGEWWESIGGSWGGRFKPPLVDGGHFSLEHEGVR